MERLVIKRSDYVLSDGTSNQTVIELDMSEFMAASVFTVALIKAYCVQLKGGINEGSQDILEFSTVSEHMIHAYADAGTMTFDVQELAASTNATFNDLPAPTFVQSGNIIQMKWSGDGGGEASSAMGRFEGYVVMHSERLV